MVASGSARQVKGSASRPPVDIIESEGDPVAHAPVQH